MAATIGVVVIFLAMRHYQKVAAWVDADEFGALPAPELPDEQRNMQLAVGAIAVGLVSFIALLLIR